MSKVGAESILTAIVAVALGTAIVLPRATRPTVWPMPHVDPSHLYRVAASLGPQPSERGNVEFSRPVRRVGEKLRRLGAASFVGGVPAALSLGYQAPHVDQAARELRFEVSELKAELIPELKGLCRYQGGAFVRAVRTWQTKKQVSLDLVELGGDFVGVASVAWLSSERRLPFSDTELELLFRVRFSSLTGTLDDERLGPGRDTMLAYYGLLLQHPPVARELWPSSRLSVIAAIAQLDPSYPADFARGLAFLDAGQPALAAEAFQAGPSSGPWARLRQNALLLAHLHGRDSK